MHRAAVVSDEDGGLPGKFDHFVKRAARKVQKAVIGHGEIRNIPFSRAPGDAAARNAVKDQAGELVELGPFLFRATAIGKNHKTPERISLEKWTP